MPHTFVYMVTEKGQKQDLSELRANEGAVLSTLKRLEPLEPLTLRRRTGFPPNIFTKVTERLKKKGLVELEKQEL